VKLLNLLTPTFRRIDPALPLPPLSLIAVLERRVDRAVTPALRAV
jgi:hypothetical protein